MPKIKKKLQKKKLFKKKLLQLNSPKGVARRVNRESYMLENRTAKN